jgi:hypothetical protein
MEWLALRDMIPMVIIKCTPIPTRNKSSFALSTLNFDLRPQILPWYDGSTDGMDMIMFCRCAVKFAIDSLRSLHLLLIE